MVAGVRVEERGNRRGRECDGWIAFGVTYGSYGNETSSMPRVVVMNVHKGMTTMVNRLLIAKVHTSAGVV